MKDNIDKILEKMMEDISEAVDNHADQVERITDEEDFRIMYPREEVRIGKCFGFLVCLN